MTTRTPFAALLVSTVILGGCVHVDLGPDDRYRESFHYNYDLQPDSRIELQGFNGSIEITGWEQNKAELSGERYASSQDVLDSIKLDIHNDAHLLDVRVTKPEQSFSRRGVNFILHVPRTAVLNRIVTSNGPITVRDMDGEARLHTSNGPVRLSDMGGAVDVQTSNGPVEATSLRGAAKIKTSNGPVRIEDIAGECNVTTSNGSIAISMSHAPRSGVRARASNGAITLRLSGDTNARIEATTSNGSINSDFNVSSGDADDRRHLSGTIGTGGPLIDLTLSNGRITLLRR